MVQLQRAGDIFIDGGEELRMSGASLVSSAAAQADGGNIKVAQNLDKEYHPLAQFREEFDSLWDRFWGGGGRGLSWWDDESRFGLNEGLEDQEHEYVFHADLPGFDPGEIDVNVSGNSLTVRAEHKEERKGKKGSSYHFGSFQRSFRFPQGVDSEKIDAKYHNGVLEVHLPKTEDSRPKRIPVTKN